MTFSEKRIPKDIDKDIDSPQGFDNDNSYFFDTRMIIACNIAWNTVPIAQN